MTAQPTPRILFSGFIDMNDFGVRQAIQPVEKPDGGAMPGPTPQKSPGLADHMVGRYNATDALDDKCAGGRMARITALLDRIPEACVSESQPRRP